MKQKIIRIASIIFTFVMKCFGKDYINFYNVEHIKRWQKRQSITQNMKEIIGNNNKHDRLLVIVDKIIDENIKPIWTKEDSDYWQIFEEFQIGNYRGDCEDIAIYYYILLRNTRKINDSDLILRTIKNPYGSGYHTVTVIHNDLCNFIIDNGKFKQESDIYRKIKVESNLFKIS